MFTIIFARQSFQLEPSEDLYEQPTTIDSYLRAFSNELGEGILQSLPPLHGPDDPCSQLLAHLLRRPYPGQALAVMGVVKRLAEARSAGVVAECGTGKTLISLASAYVASEGKPFIALVLAPSHLTTKWARESLRTVPRARVFLFDGLRDSVCKSRNGIQEVKLRGGQVVRERLKMALTDLRLRRGYRTARARWNSLSPGPAIWISSKEVAKLGYFWRHTYNIARSGRFHGSVVNPDTGRPIYAGEEDARLLTSDFKKVRLSEWIGSVDERDESNHHARRELFSPLWQADRSKVRRCAVIEFIGRYLPDFFDFGIADEVHELKGSDTAQGNALGTLAACVKKLIILTGTLLGGYADDVYNILFRADPAKMIEYGFEHDEGVRPFMETYGLLETITTIEPAENACSEAKITRRVRRRPGASPQLFGDLLMPMAAFLSLEDIAQALPPYQEEVVPVEMDEPLRKAYEKLEEQIKEGLKEHRGNNSVVSVAMNALLLYPDRPFGLGALYGWEYDPQSGRRERFVIAEPEDLDEGVLYAKERKLLEEIQSSLNRGRKVHVFAVYTRLRDVTRRLERILQREGIRVAVLTSDVKPEVREAWYDRQSRQRVQVVISHPKLVSLGLNLLEYKDLIFWETGYSLYTLRQASRRSWRIGQTEEVTVKYFAYARTAQETCLRLMGRKLLVAMGMEGKFSTEGLQAEGDDDLLMAMARELVTEKGIGENAQAVWRAIQQQHAAMSHVAPATVEMPCKPEARPCDIPVLSQELLADVSQLLLFGAPLATSSARKSGARRRPPTTSGASTQLGLF